VIHNFSTIFVSVALTPALLLGSAPPDVTPWCWQTNIPAHLTTAAAPMNRDAEAFRQFFPSNPGPHSISSFVDKFGRPDGYSSQGYYSLELGRGPCSDSLEGISGTLRFILPTEQEVHMRICSGEFICETFLVDKDGNGELLYK
jgi:hypothetical protein